LEVEGRVVSQKGKLTAAVVKVRKESGELVTIGRQWVTPALPAKANKTSKL
jgi:acyl-coenzyme A thioesterase 13